MTQNEMVLNHLQTRGEISPREALDQYGIMRLGARIYDLRKCGYKIQSIDTPVKNRFGKTVIYTTYKMEAEK